MKKTIIGVTAVGAMLASVMLPADLQVALQIGLLAGIYTMLLDKV